jgi:hypothetical protein
MPAPSPLNDLRREYRQLHLSDHRSLTPDQARSLSYYFTELSLIHDPGSAAVAGDRVMTWSTSVLALDAFVHAEKRMPRENNRLPRDETPQVERRLADWATYQRTPATRAQHCDYQRRRLSVIPGFSWSPLDDRWWEAYREYRAFITAHGRAPRYRSEEQDEKRLAAWAAKQRWRHRRSVLPGERSQALSALTVWTWT